MHFGFEWIGLVIFTLPMLINVLYVILPPKNGNLSDNGKYPLIEGVEQVTRVCYLIVLCVLKSNTTISFKSAYLYISVVFLCLYYFCWIRYFVGGRNLEDLQKIFLFVPQPLAVYPVLYFLFAALWLHNYPAFAVMILFGIAHNIVTYRNCKATRT